MDEPQRSPYEAIPKRIDTAFRSSTFQMTNSGIPDEPIVTITVGPKQGVRVALRLLADSLVAAVRRTTVSVEMRHEPKVK